MDDHPEFTALRATLLRLYVAEEFGAATPHVERLIALVGDDEAEAIIEELSEEADALMPDDDEA